MSYWKFARRDGASGLWKFDEPAGVTPLNYGSLGSPGNCSGSWTGATNRSRWGSLPFDGARCARLDGSTNTLDTPINSAWDTHAGASGVMSCDAWIRPLGAFTAAAFIFALGESAFYAWNLYVTTGGVLGFNTYQIAGADCMVATGGQLRLGRWYHVAATYNRATPLLRIFINGREAARSTSAAGNTSAVNHGLRFGIRQDGGGTKFQGDLADVAYYPTELTGAQVTSHARYPGFVTRGPFR